MTLHRILSISDGSGSIQQNIWNDPEGAQKAFTSHTNEKDIIFVALYEKQNDWWRLQDWYIAERLRKKL